MKSVQLNKREGCVIIPSGRHRAGYFLLWPCLSSSGKKPAPQVRVTPAHPCQCSAGGLMQCSCRAGALHGAASGAGRPWLSKTSRRCGNTEGFGEEQHKRSHRLNTFTVFQGTQFCRTEFNSHLISHK